MYVCMYACMYVCMYVILVTNGTIPTSTGTSVCLSSDGSTLAVGGPRDDGFTGAVWIYQWRGGTFTQLNEKLVGFNYTGGSAEGTCLVVKHSYC